LEGRLFIHGRFISRRVSQIISQNSAERLVLFIQNYNSPALGSAYTFLSTSRSNKKEPKQAQHTSLPALKLWKAGRSFMAGNTLGYLIPDYS